MNILTFDIEEWFHILDHPSTRGEEQWVRFPERIEANCDRILEILSSYDHKATFYCVGWIVQKYPQVINKIIDSGYEVGTHTMMHQLVYEQTKNEFKQDMIRCVGDLEDLSGKKVKHFRAPGFSITERNKWAIEVIAELGIETDSSIFPTQRAHGGFPSFGQAKPSIILYNGIAIKEFPINIKTIMNREIIFTGGGYFRLFPYSMIKKWCKESDYIMSYLHPRDFDKGQPIIADLPISRKIKSYIGISSAQSKLEKWLSDFEFTDVSTADKLVDWSKANVIKL